jgi:hypothetical protein
MVVSVVNPIGLVTEAESRNLLFYEGRLQPSLVSAVKPMSAIEGKADVRLTGSNCRFAPKPDIGQNSLRPMKPVVFVLL